MMSDVKQLDCLLSHSHRGRKWAPLDAGISVIVEPVPWTQYFCNLRDYLKTSPS